MHIAIGFLKSMTSKSSKIYLVIFLLLFTSSVIYLVYNQSIRLSLEYINTQIIQPALPGIHFRLTNGEISWKIHNYQLNIVVRNIKLQDESNRVLALIPQVFCPIKWINIFNKHPIVNKITISQAKFFIKVNQCFLYNNYSTSIKNFFAQVSNVISKISDIKFHIELLATQLISATGKKLYIKYIDIKPGKYVTAINLITQKKQNAHLQISHSAANIYTIAMQLYDIDSSLDLVNILHNNEFTFSGMGKVTFNTNGEILYADFRVMNCTANLTYFCTRCKVKESQADILFIDDKLQIKRLAAKIDNTDVKAYGTIDLVQKTSLLHIQADKVFFTELFQYLPNNTNVKIKEIFTKGYLKDIRISLDLYNPKHTTIDMYIKDSVLVFKEQKLAFTRFNSFAKFTDNQLYLNNLTSELHDVALAGNAIIKNIGLDNFNYRDLIFDVKGVSKSSVQALYRLLNNEFIANNLYDIRKIDKQIIAFQVDKLTGKIQTRFKYKLVDKVITTDIDLKLRDFSGAQIYKRFALTKTDLHLHFINDQLFINGQGLANNRAINLAVSLLLGKEESYKCTFTGNFMGNDLLNMVFDKTNDLQGEVTGKIVLKKEPYKDIYLYVNTDLSKVLFTIKPLKWQNKQEYHPMLSMQSRITSNAMIIDKLTIQGKDIDLAIHGTLNHATNIIVDKFSLFKNDLRGTYKKVNDFITVDIKGNHLDLSNFDYDITDDYISNYSITTNLQKVTLKNKILLHDVKLILNSKPFFTGKFYGRFTNDKKVNAVYKNDSLYLVSEDAGRLLTGLDIITFLREGKLYLTTKEKAGVTQAKLHINAFTMMQVPALVKLLSLASFYGIINILNGKEGLYFDHLSSTFDCQGNVCNFDDSWLEGAELGISFSGPLSINEQMFYFSGSVVPIYLLNKLIRNLPLLGKLITGERGEAIISADYRIKNYKNEHSVSVDPFSILSPRLLQKYFRALKATLRLH